MNDLAIIILNYNTYEMTLDLVSSLNRICPKESCSIIVVDNASPNESAQLLQENAKKTNLFTFIKSEKNGGYAAGNNVGLKYAVEQGFAYSLVLNNDIEIDSYQQIQNMIDLMSSNTKIGAVSPRIIGKDGKNDPPIYFKKPSFWDLSLGIKENNRQRYSFNENRLVQIYAPRGSCMLLKNEALKKIDFLDEYTFLYYEEPILAERLSKMGFESWLCGTSCVVHNHAVTISKSINKNKIIETISRSYRYYLSKYRHFNIFQTRICVLIRKLAIMARR